jgi:hypothetical protein
MVRYIFAEGKVYPDDGSFTPIPRRRVLDFGSYGLLILLEKPGVPVIPGQEGPDVYSRREER